MMKKIHKSLAILFSFTLFLGNAKAFSDVPVDSWFYPYVQDLVGKGIVDNAEKYRPEDELNRAELVKMVIIATDEDNKEALPGHPTFNDVPHNEWFAPFVERAATLGIVSGYADPEGNLTGWFGPGDDVTRGQAVKILVEAFDLQASSGNATQYKDVAGPDWFYNYVHTASSLGIVEGYDDGTFKPNQAVKRSEMAKMLSLAMNPEEVEPETPGEETPNEEQPGEETPNEEQPGEETPNEGTVFKPNPANLNSAILVPDDDEKFVGKYTFKGLYEDFTVNTVTIVNDITGNTLGDDPKQTLAIKEIILKYPDKDGHLKTATGQIGADGTAKFNNLDFFVKRDVNSYLEIYAILNDFSEVGEQLSGEAIRLAIKNTNNDTNTFKAVGNSSQEVITLDEDGLNLSNSSEIFIIRKSVPTFELLKKTEFLTEGTNDLIALKIKANESGSVSLGRLIFNIDVSDNNNLNLTLDNFKIFNGSNVIEKATIYDATGAQDISSMGGGSLTDGLSKVIVSFDQEQVISSGETRTFYLKADIQGSDNDDSINTKLATEDDNAPLSGLTKVGQENTGKIFVNGDSTAGIFTASATDFSETVGNALNVLWSDMSSSLHQYPEVTLGSVTSDSGSADWTNGYRLGIGSLGGSVLTK